jgi:hypothetical protein
MKTLATFLKEIGRQGQSNVERVEEIELGREKFALWGKMHFYIPE